MGGVIEGMGEGEGAYERGVSRNKSTTMRAMRAMRALYSSSTVFMLPQ